MGVADVYLGNDAADGGTDGAVRNGFLQCLEGGHQLGWCLCRCGCCSRCCLGGAAFSAFNSLIFRPGDDALFEQGCFQTVIYGRSTVAVGGRRRCGLGGGGNLASKRGCLGLILGGVDFKELVPCIDNSAYVGRVGNQIP